MHSIGRWPANRGSVFLLAMVALICLLILGVSLMEVAVNGLDRASRDMRGIEALTLAESGVDMAITKMYYNEIDTTPASGTYTNTLSLPQGTATYTVNWPFNSVPDTFEIVSAANSWTNRAETVRAIVYLLETTPRAFESAIFSDSNIQWQGGGSILPDSTGSGGDMYANGNIDFGGTSFYMDSDATIYTTGVVTGTPPSDATIMDHIVPVPMPSLDLSYYKQLALEEQAATGVQHYFKGTGKNWMLPSQLNLSGIVYIDGSVKIAGNYTGTATIVASGTITITGTADSLSPATTKIAFMSPTSVVMQGGAKVYGLVYSHGVTVDATATIGGNVYVEGVIAADRIITGNGSFTVRYRDVWDLEYPSKGLDQFAQVSWETIHPSN